MSGRDQILERIERELSERPSLREAPPGLRARVMHDIGAIVPIRRRIPPAVITPLAVAASLAIAALLSMYGGVRALKPEPAMHTQSLAVHTGPSLDPVPMIRPAAAFVAQSVERPLVTEGKFMLEDTRRAADFVVSCLPFTGG